MQLLADEKRKEIGYVVFYAVLVFKKLWLKTHHTQYLLINAELSWYNYAKYSKPTFGVFNFWCNYLILAKKLPNLKIAFFADFYFIWSFEILIFFFNCKWITFISYRCREGSSRGRLCSPLCLLVQAQGPWWFFMVPCGPFFNCLWWSIMVT